MAREFSEAVLAIVKKYELPKAMGEALITPFRVPPLGELAAKACSCTTSCACTPIFEWELQQEAESEG